MNAYTKQYLFLAHLDNVGIPFWTNGNISVCPECRVDDFVHVEGCSLAEMIKQNKIGMVFYPDTIRDLTRLFNKLERRDPA